MTEHQFPAGDPVPAIPEADATGEIAAIYGDIRETLGVPVVNLIWRHLATMPDALPWTWSVVRPIYASGAVGRAAAHLRGSMELPAVTPWPADVIDSLGLDSADLAGIGRVLASYDRSNAMNMVALGALKAVLEQRQDTSPLAEVADTQEVDGALPKLLTFPEMQPATANLVYRLNAFGDSEHRVIASMYRHLAHWPPFLALIWERLEPINRSGELDRIIAANQEIARGISARLSAELSPPATALPAEVQAQIRGALDLFLTYAIGRMVPIGRLVAHSFTEAR